MMIKLIIKLWRSYNMCKNVLGVVKGIGTGLAAGIIVGALGCQMINNDKHMKKKASKAMHSMGDLIDNVQYMFR